MSGSRLSLVKGLTDGDGVTQEPNDGYISLLLNAAIQNEKELPNIAQHQYEELASIGVFDGQNALEEHKTTKSKSLNQTSIGGRTPS